MKRRSFLKSLAACITVPGVLAYQEQPTNILGTYSGFTIDEWNGLMEVMFKYHTTPKCAIVSPRFFERLKKHEMDTTNIYPDSYLIG